MRTALALSMVIVGLVFTIAWPWMALKLFLMQGWVDGELAVVWALLAIFWSFLALMFLVGNYFSNQREDYAYREQIRMYQSRVDDKYR